MNRKKGQQTRTMRGGSMASAAFAALAFALPARAADDLFELPIESLMQLNVSVASPFEESVMNSASSVSVLRPADWQARGARSLEEALEQVPSVVAYPSLGGASMYAIRGYANEISVRGTALQLDGVPLNSYSYATASYSLPFLALPLLERLEVIRGPGSTLYGSDAFHGVVALSTWQPSAARRGEVRVTAGSPRHDQASATFADALAPNVRTSGGFAWTDYGNADIHYPYTNPQTGVQHTGAWQDNEQDVEGFLRLELGDADRGLWRASVFADRYDGDRFPGVGSQFYRPLASSFQTMGIDYLQDRDHTGQESTFWLAQVQHERSLSPHWRLDVRAFAWQADQTWILDSTAYPLSLTTLGNVVMPCRTSPNEPPTTSPLYCPHWQYQGTDEVRRGLHVLARHDAAPATEWAVGAGRDWFEVRSAPLRRIGTAGQVYYDMPSPFAGAQRHVDHLLLQARTVNAPWTFVYGARWDDYSDIGDALSPRLALIYRQPEAPWTTKLQYSHAFRAPSAAEQYGSGGGTQQQAGLDLQNETIDTLELAWQYQRDDHDTELVLFASQWQDGVVLVPVSVGVNRYENTGENSSHGLELTHHRTLGRWRMEGNLSWVSSTNDRTGLDYVGFPHWLANLLVSRRIGDAWEVGINERVLADMAEGDTLGSYVPPPAPDYLRTDLQVGWRRGDLHCTLDVRNLFNRDNVLPSMFNASGGVPEPNVDVLFSVSKGL